MSMISAGIAQERAPALPTPEVKVSNPLPRSTAHDRLSWELGRGDAAAGLPWRVGPDEILARTFDGDRDVLSYLVGYRAGELDRAKGGAHAAAL